MIALVAVPLAPQATVIRAATLKELADQKRQLQAEIDAKKKEADEKKRQAAEQEKLKNQLQNTIVKLDTDITTTEKRIDQASNDIVSTQGAIESQRERISQKELEIQKKREELNESTAEAYMAQTENNQIYAIFSSDRISSALDQIAAYGSLEDKLVRDGEELGQQLESLLAEKAKLEQKQQELEGQKRQLAAYQKALDSQKQQKAALAEQAKQAQIQLTNQSKEAIAEAEKLRKQFAVVANEEAAMRRASSKRATASAVRGDAPPSSYGLVWPVSGAIITTYFGGSTPFQGYHTGLDLALPAGSPIRAASSGVVTLATKMCCSDYSDTVDKSYGFGNYSMIRHDNGLVTLYAHQMEMLVTPGERVERGQVIGYVGGARGMPGAGWSTGAHLHFEVRDAQGPDDPLKYLP